MKGWGIACVVIGALNLIIGIIATFHGANTANFSSAVLFLVLGAFLISRARKKEQEKKDKEKWNKQ